MRDFIDSGVHIWQTAKAIGKKFLCRIVGHQPGEKHPTLGGAPSTDWAGFACICKRCGATVFKER